MTDGVDASVHRSQAACFDLLVHGSSADPKPQQLPTRDHTVLPFRKLANQAGRAQTR
jgi:hypothetical protein